MEALKPNMYVRTKQGKIGKIIDINLGQEEKRYILDSSSVYIYCEEDISKASHNIVDLLEVGDVITTNNLCGEVTHIEGDKIYTTCYDGEYCYDYQIQSILTCEQYESMKYEVK